MSRKRLSVFGGLGNTAGLYDKNPRLGGSTRLDWGDMPMEDRAAIMERLVSIGGIDELLRTSAEKMPETWESVYEFVRGKVDPGRRTTLKLGHELSG